MSDTSIPENRQSVEALIDQQEKVSRVVSLENSQPPSNASTLQRVNACKLDVVGTDPVATHDNA